MLGCRVTKAGWCLRRGGPGDWTTAKSRGTSCNADKTGSTLDELMQSHSSNTGNLIGGDSLAGGGAALAGVRLSGLVGGILHVHVANLNTYCNALPSMRWRCMVCIRLSLNLQWQSAIIASSSLGVFPSSPDIKPLSVVHSSMSFSHSSCMRFLVAGESDGDAGDSSYHSSGEP